MAQTVSELAIRLNRRHVKKGKFPPLLLMTDTERLPDPSRIIPKLPSGSGVIVRHFSRSSKIELVRKIKKLCLKHKVKLLVSDDVSLALSQGLDGVHLSEKALRKVAGCGRLVRPKPDFFVSAACHSQLALCQAERAQIDAVLISPVFETDSHPHARSKKPWSFQNLTRNTSLKPYALGGLNGKTAQRLCHTRVCGFAGISGLV